VKKVSKFQYSILVCALGVFLSWGITECFAAPAFYSTNDPVGHWFVSFNQNLSGNGQLTSFKTDNFIQAVAVTVRQNQPDYIANNNTGTTGGMEQWAFFVFRQTFDLTGYDPATAVLTFQWAADDSGQGGDRGTWVPKFKLNGGDWYGWPGPSAETYDYGNESSLSSGFISGLNTIDFYVEGNGVTDGFELRKVSFIARESSAVPEPATMLLLGFGIVGLAGVRRFK
jgi:hypothetical protein